MNESQNIEWKRSWRDEYLKWVCGFANAQGGVYRVETFPVPREAMREAVINAVIHRDYASPTTIQISVHDDRIVIWNAVQLPPGWAADQLTGEFSSKPHNPRIAYAFFRAGMIEAWGRGIRRITEICKEAGNPAPEWELQASGDGLWLRFPFSAAYHAADAPAGGAAAQKTTPKVTQEREKTREKTREKILALIIANPSITTAELANRVGITTKGIEWQIGRLRKKGILERTGPAKGGHWKVVETGDE